MDTSEKNNSKLADNKPLVSNITPVEKPFIEQKEQREPDQHENILSVWNKVIILTGSCYNAAVAIGFPVSIAIMYVELLDDFKTTRRETSLIQSVSIACTLGLSLLSGVFIEVTGVRCSLLVGAALGSVSLFSAWFATSVPYLIVTIGLVAGTSNSLIYLATNVIVAKAFKKRRKLCLVAIMVAAGVGQSVLPPMLAVLQDKYGWRGCFLITTGLYLNVMVSTSAIASNLGLRLIQKCFRGKRSQTQWKKLLNPIFICLVLSGPVSLAATNNVFVAVVDILRSKGISEETGLTLLITCFCIGLFSRLAIGSLSQIKVFHSLMLFSICSLAAGCSVIAVAHTNKFTVIVIFLCILSIGHGGMASLISVVSLDVTSVQVLTISLGMFAMMLGVMMPVGSALIGWLFDTRKTYDLPLLICGGVCVVSGLLIFVLFLLHRRSSQKA